MIIAATGHRPPKLGGYKIPNPTQTKLIDLTKEILTQWRPNKAISGMALGYDQYFAQACLELAIPLIAAIPCEGQEKIWPESSQKIYHDILAQAAEVVIVSPGSYAPEKMKIRNHWMVDRCDKLLAAFDGSPGGTGECVSYAQKINRDIIRINTQTWEITEL